MLLYGSVIKVRTIDWLRNGYTTQNITSGYLLTFLRWLRTIQMISVVSFLEFILQRLTSRKVCIWIDSHLDLFIDEFSEPSFTAIFITKYQFRNSLIPSHARIHMIPTRIQQWKGYILFLSIVIPSPVIFVIYISTKSEASAVTQFLLAKDFSEQVQIYTYEGKEGCFDNEHFPINKLRNMAIQYVQTTHYIVLDMDVSLSSE